MTRLLLTDEQRKWHLEVELACGFRYCVYLVIKYERLDFSFESDSSVDKMVPDSLKCSRKPLQNGKPHPWFDFILEDYNYLTSFPPFLFFPLGPFIPLPVLFFFH